MGTEGCIGAKRCFGSSNAACTIRRTGSSTRQDPRVGKLCPRRFDGPPQEAERIRRRDRPEFRERARLILVMSFWKSEKDAGNRWESSAVILKMVAPLIDVCTRVHTYQAAMPGFPNAPLPVAATPIC